MTKRSVIMCACTVVMLVYLAFAMAGTNGMAGHAAVGDMRISVADSLHTGFITADDISRNFVHGYSKGAERKSLRLRSIEAGLNASDKIERANVALLNDGTLAIDVQPMVPVARVFDKGGHRSYYINAEGKRIGAEARFHIDVPVVCGTFSDKYPAARLLPLLRHIAADTELDALVSTVVSEPDGDIIIVPSIRGHVINFGDTTDVHDKFTRLRAFYRSVPRVRGWESYDTISVKWRGQVVASRRPGHLAPVELAVAEVEYNDADNETVMGTDPDDPDNGIIPDDAYTR